MAGIQFGLRLRELREGAGLTQPQLAERAGMTKDGIAQLEQGRREPAWASVQALADALGVSCDEFRRPHAESAGRGRGRPPKAEQPADAEPPKRGRKKK